MAAAETPRKVRAVRHRTGDRRLVASRPVEGPSGHWVSARRHRAGLLFAHHHRRMVSDAADRHRRERERRRHRTLQPARHLRRPDLVALRSSSTTAARETNPRRQSRTSVQAPGRKAGPRIRISSFGLTRRTTSSSSMPWSARFLPSRLRCLRFTWPLFTPTREFRPEGLEDHDRSEDWLQRRDDESAEAQRGWTSQRFVEAFVIDQPQARTLILENARVAGLSNGSPRPFCRPLWTPKLRSNSAPEQGQKWLVSKVAFAAEKPGRRSHRTTKKGGVRRARTRPHTPGAYERTVGRYRCVCAHRMRKQTTWPIRREPRLGPWLSVRKPITGWSDGRTRWRMLLRKHAGQPRLICLSASHDVPAELPAPSPGLDVTLGEPPFAACGPILAFAFPRSNAHEDPQDEP